MRAHTRHYGAGLCVKRGRLGRLYFFLSVLFCFASFPFVWNIASLSGSSPNWLDFGTRKKCSKFQLRPSLISYLWHWYLPGVGPALVVFTLPGCRRFSLAACLPACLSGSFPVVLVVLLLSQWFCCCPADFEWNAWRELPAAVNALLTRLTIIVAGFLYRCAGGVTTVNQPPLRRKRKARRATTRHKTEGRRVLALLSLYE